MLRSKLSQLREYITPVSNESQYLKNGTITPNEFVIAGNYLQDKFITWTWNIDDDEINQDTLKIRSFLPNDKQFLVSRKILCYKRCEDIDTLNKKNDISEVEKFDAENNVWVVENVNEDEKHIQKSTEVGDDDYGFEEDLVLEENERQSDGESIVVLNEQNKRYYDLYILYSTSYRVPKLYLVGYNHDGQPLTPNQMLEDVSEEYRKKTATIEDLPVFKNKTPSISIHPCKHGDVMKLLMTRMQQSQSVEDDSTFPVDTYLIIFLKFINSVVPTMEYDFTMDGG